MNDDRKVKVYVDVEYLDGKKFTFECYNIPVYSPAEDSYILPSHTGPIALKRSELKSLKHRYNWNRL